MRERNVTKSVNGKKLCVDGREKKRSRGSGNLECELVTRKTSRCGNAWWIEHDGVKDDDRAK